MAQRRMNKWNENEKWKFNLFHATKVLNGKACKAFKFQVWVESFELGMFRVSDRGSDAIRTNEIWSRSQAPMRAKDVIVLATFKRGKLKRVLVSASSWIRWRQFAARNARYHSLLIHTFCHFLSISHPQAVSCDVCMFKVVSSGTLSFSAFIKVSSNRMKMYQLANIFIDISLYQRQTRAAKRQLIDSIWAFWGQDWCLWVSSHMPASSLSFPSHTSSSPRLSVALNFPSSPYFLFPFFLLNLEKEKMVFLPKDLCDGPTHFTHRRASIR